MYFLYSEKLIEIYREEIIKDCIIIDKIDYQELNIEENSVLYKNIKAK